MKSSRFALGAAVGILLGATLVPAKAADLGGGCCADLEERVAELEATTARKGNRVVSLQIYGQVNKGLLVWDDGVDSDAYVVDNSIEGSRFGFTGSATIKQGLTAGYTMEFELNDAPSDAVTQGKGGDDPDGDFLWVRQNYMYVDSEKLGRISIGRQTTAADGGTEVVIGESIRHSDPNFGAGLRLRFGNDLSDVTLGDLAGNLNPDPNNVIRYDTPSIGGFILSASWGDNDYADVAVRFEKEFSSLKVAAALAYIWDSQTSFEEDYEQLGGSVSIMHVPTGLYAAFQAGSRDYEDDASADSSFWYVQGGIEKQWFAAGATTLYGEYGLYNDYMIEGAETTRWGLGINQKIEKASMDVYAHATFWSFDGVTDDANREAEDISTLMVGSRIQF